jgi:endonuclease/exonuclease/phosphatase family metal-dependent hydrolase
MQHARMRALIAALAAACALALPAAAPAAVVPVTVQTQNLYLGADLTPAIAAGTDVNAFFAAANQIWAGVKATDFPTRAKRIALEMSVTKPDIINLQEVSNWQATNLSPTSHEPSFDYLAILQSALAARGLSYTVASTSDNANIGPVPLPSPASPQFLLQFHDRDVILVRTKQGLAASNPQHGNYVHQQSFVSPAGPISFNRGWASATITDGGRTFKFVDTHLETESFPSVQEAQADELLAGPASGPGPMVLAGDFNSAADGSQTATYGKLTAAFTDSWSSGLHLGNGLSCCQAADLRNPVSQLATRIDLVLTKGAQPKLKPLDTLVGFLPIERINGLWPSDHAGLFATVFP